ncbi:MAG: class I SAM-dependent methyltransferase [Thermoanaerobaculia bacterium]
MLEYGCGEGKFAVSLASLGATVDAIDISGVALETASRNAAAQHAMIGFRLMNAEDLEYEDDTFDLICGRSILHHLDLEQALSEISRTLKADGKAIFLEPLGHNPILNVARRVTPQLRSADEHPLLSVDIESARRHFESVEARYFHLSSLLAIPFRRAPGVRALVRALEAFDKILVATFLRKYAWVVVLTLARPKKSSAHRRPSR